MKKRLLAFALTLAMVITSISMLSFVSFADTAEAQTTAADGDLYAWMYTLNLDGSVGKDDPYILANNNLLSNMIMCTAWDYDYVYLQIYYHSLSDTTKQYLNSITWTVGGATATVKGANSTPVFGGTYGKASANLYAWEVSIPLSAINAKLTDGVLSADMALDITYDSDNKTISKDYNLIFSGRSMITRFWDINNNATETNGYIGFDVCSYRRTATPTAGYISEKSTVPAAGLSGIQGGKAENGNMVFWDYTAHNTTHPTDSVTTQATMGNIVEKVGYTAGGANHFDMTLNIGNLKAQSASIASNPDSAGFGSNQCIFQIMSGSRTRGNGNNVGARIGIYQDSSNNHLMLMLEGASSHYDLTSNLGITEGMNFRIGANEYADGTVEVLINEKAVLKGTAVINSFTSNGGAMSIVLKRAGNLDTNSNNTTDASEYLKVTVDQFTMSKLNDVDVDTVKTFFKTVNGANAGVTPSAVLDAKFTASVPGVATAKNLSGSPISIGSASKAWATWNFEKEMLYILLDNQNVDKFNLNIGGMEASVTYTKKSDKFVDTAERGCVSLVPNATVPAGVTVTMDPLYNGVAGTPSPTDVRGYNRTLVAIPLSLIKFDQTDAGVVYANMSITATFVDSAVRKEGKYVGVAEGTLVLGTSADPTGVMGMGSHSITTGGTSVVTTSVPAASMNAVQRGVSTNYGMSFNTNLAIKEKFTLTLTNLKEYSSTAIKGETHGYGAGIKPEANAMDRMVFGLSFQRKRDMTSAELNGKTAVTDGLYKGGAIFAFINTSDKGVVLTFTDYDGNVTVYETGVTHTNGSATNIDFEFIVNADNSADVYIGSGSNRRLLAEISDCRSIMNDDGKWDRDGLNGITSLTYNVAGDKTSGVKYPEERGGAVFVSSDFGTAFEFYYRSADGSTKMDMNLSKLTCSVGIWAHDVQKFAGRIQTDVPDALTKLAYVQESVDRTTPYDVRFTATIDAESVATAISAGFEISVMGSAKGIKDIPVDTVYSAILANTAEGLRTIKAEEGEYLMTVTVHNGPVSGTQTFIAKPYFVDNYGGKYNGEAYCITYTDGEYMGYEKYKEPTVFDGKAVVTFGDSITWYNGNAYTWGKEKGQIAKGYQYYLEEELGLTVYNQGYSGNTMPQIMRYAREYTNFKNVDYMTVMSGANDERRNTPLGTLAAKGSTFDTTTYIGALQSGIEYALSQNPNITIVLFTPIVGWIYADGTGNEGYAYDYDKANQPTTDGIITEKWANAVKEVAALYGLKVCDLYNDCEIQYNVQDRIDYMVDPEPENGNELYSLHPNTEGYKLLAKEIIKTFKELTFEGKTCVTFGASNTWYDGNAYTWGKAAGQIAVGYQSYMRSELGMNVINRGVSGITLPNNVAQQIKSAELLSVWKDVDYVTIKGGINEERRNTPMGTLMPKGSDFDTTTFIGSLQSGIEYILEQNPDITIMLLTTTNAWIYADGVGQEGYAYDYDKENQPTTDGRIPEKWADAMKQVAALYGLPVCDLYNEVPFNTVEDREKYINDPEPPENQLYSTHPTAEGYKIVADVIIDSFLDIALTK